MLRIMLVLGQIGLCIMFGYVGFLKVMAPMPDLAIVMPWVLDVPSWLVRVIGVSEMFASVGLVLPALLRYKTRLVGYAALGIAVIMILALVFHLVRGEWSYFVVNAATAAVAIFVAWGRLYEAPVSTRDNYHLADFRKKSA